MNNRNYLKQSIVAFGIIFVFASCNKTGQTTSTTQSTSEQSSAGGDKFGIAHFHSDSLLNNLEFFTKAEAALNVKKEGIEKELRNKELGLQREFQKMQENAQNMSRKEIEAAQQKLGRMEQDLMKRKENLATDLAKETSEFNDELHSRVNEFLTEIKSKHQYKYVFSVEKGGNIFYADPSLDITKEMIDGMNAKYK